MTSPEIFLVDANRTVRRIAERVLGAAGHRVRGFEHGAEALRAAERAKPGLVLLDVRAAALPAPADSLEGPGLRRAFAESATLADVPFVAMVARADDAPRPGGETGAWLDTLAKPFAPEALLASIARAAGLAEGAEPEEVLAGKLEHVAVADVLQLLAAQQQTGTLELRADELGVALGLCRGRIDLATAEGPPARGVRLGRFLVEDGACSRRAIDEALAAQGALRAEQAARRPPGTLLGGLLVTRGVLAREALVRALGRQSAEILGLTLRASRGSFRFVRLHALPEAAEARLGLAVPPMLLEGLRRLDEWRLLEARAAAGELVLERDEVGARSLGDEALSEPERGVLARLDGRTPLRDLATSVPDALAPTVLRLLALRVARVVSDD